MYEEENVETMTIHEVARMIDCCRSLGMSDTDICECLKHIATGANLPIQKTTGV